MARQILALWQGGLTTARKILALPGSGLTAAQNFLSTFRNILMSGRAEEASSRNILTPPPKLLMENIGNPELDPLALKMPAPREEPQRVHRAAPAAHTRSRSSGLRTPLSLPIFAACA